MLKLCKRGNHLNYVLKMEASISARIMDTPESVLMKSYCSFTPPGAGAGRGGGAGGSIKESGGGLGKMGAAKEDGYFYEESRKQLDKLKKLLKSDQELKKGDDPDK